VHWKETHKGDTVTHVQDYNRQQVCTNITQLNRVPIPAAFDQFDINAQLNNTRLSRMEARWSNCAIATSSRSPSSAWRARPTRARAPRGSPCSPRPIAP